MCDRGRMSPRVVTEVSRPSGALLALAASLGASLVASLGACGGAGGAPDQSHLHDGGGSDGGGVGADTGSPPTHDGSTPKTDASPLDATAPVDAMPTGPTPTLTAGTWVNITPSGVNLAPGCCTTYPNVGYENNTFGIDWIEIDPSNPYTLYACADVEGIWKTTDGGSTWKRLGTPPAAPTYASTVTYLDSPIRVRVDPKDSKHLSATEGVRGNALGFWVSNDGGDTWTQPPGFITAEKMATNDVTTMVVDPTDFNHVLVGSHSPWAMMGNAGILETKDGGETFVLHPPQADWPSGSLGIQFLFDPAKGVGNAETWLASVSGIGLLRTTDSGTTWNLVSTSGTMHGGENELYFAKNGAVYAGANNTMLRSTDEGASWTSVGPQSQDGYYQVIGDGNVLYGQSANTGTNTTGPAPYVTSKETDGLTWSPYQSGVQTFSDGPYVMRFDSVNRILYSANWDAGVWALKVLP
jgi:photosystem II stability/assembly factor-like uncharacterized protein